MAKRHKPLDIPNIEFECERDDEIENAWVAPALGLPAHKQTQDRLIKMEIDLVGGLTALADKIEYTQFREAIRTGHPDLYQYLPDRFDLSQWQEFATRLMEKLIETGNSAPPKPIPDSTHMSLADFNKALPSRLTALQEDIERQINRISSLLF